jgi:hypothetical protein
MTAPQVADALRKLLNANGMNEVKIVGYEHNWDNSAFPANVVCIEPSKRPDCESSCLDLYSYRAHLALSMV